MLKHLVYDLRRSPLQGLVDDILPLNMSRRTLGAVVSLFLASGPMGSTLEKADAAYERSSKRRPMTSRQLRRELEAMRVADLAAFRADLEWQKYGRISGAESPREHSTFHYYFRPRGLE